MHLHVFNIELLNRFAICLNIYVFVSLFKVYRALWLWACFQILLLEIRQNL